jgi:DNA-binding protein HU-beta
VNQKEIISDIASETGLAKKNIERVISAFRKVLFSILKREGRLAVAGFGVFDVRHRKGRKGRNPRTGETLLLPPKDYLAFRPSKKLSGRLSK